MESRQKQFVSIAMMNISLLALLIWIMLSPLTGLIAKSAGEYEENNRNLNILNKKESIFLNYRKEYQDEKSNASSINSFFLGKDEIVGFISTLEGIADDTGNDFSIQAVNSYEAKEDTKESYLTLRISLWGSFDGLLSFVANLEDSPYPPYRLLEIDYVSIKKAIDSSDKNPHPGAEIESVIGIKVYTKNEN